MNVEEALSTWKMLHDANAAKQEQDKKQGLVSLLHLLSESTFPFRC